MEAVAEETHSKEESQAAVGLDLSKETSDSVVEITEPTELSFSPEEVVTCKQIRVSNASVKISGLTLHGSIRVISGNLLLRNCRISNPMKGTDHLLTVSDRSVCCLIECDISDTQYFGVCVEALSSLTAQSTTFSNTSFAAVSLYSQSNAHFTSCEFHDSGTDLLWVDLGSDALVASCRFSDAKRRGITVISSSSLTAHQCSFANCRFGAISTSFSASISISSCVFESISHTAIYSEETKIDIDQTTFSKCLGNAVNCSRNSILSLRRSSIAETSFPAIALCDGSAATVDGCYISSSALSGIAVRFGSNADVSNCVICDCLGSGISVNDSPEVMIKDCEISRCGRSGVEVYNESKGTIEKCRISEVGTAGVDCFTGSTVDVKESDIESEHYGVKAHHGGGYRMESCVVREKEWEDESSGYEIVCSVINGEKVSRKGGAKGERRAKCFKCGNDASCCHYSPCGHCVICKECWDSLEQKPEKCELCGFKVEKLLIPVGSCCEGDKICSVCYCNEQDSTIIPCGHRICSECAKHWFQSSSTCPICRAENSRARKDVEYA